MKMYMFASSIAALGLVVAAPVTAQTSSETKVSTDTGMKDGMATKKVKVVHIRKHKTRHAKRILGVKVGHKTRVSKTVKETTTSANGDHSTTVKHNNN